MPDIAGWRRDRLSEPRAGVVHAWLVNPLLQTLEALRLESGRWSTIATHDGRALVRVEPFEAIDLELGALWV